MRRGSHAEAFNAFSQWCTYNDVQLLDITLAADDEKGNHFQPTRDLENEDDNIELPLLLTVPKDLVLSSEAIHQYAKVDKNFREIFSRAGHQSHRVDTLLFLMLQYIYSSPDYQGTNGEASPWAWYFDMLPFRVPVPTMWNEDELPAVSAKLISLNKEFDEVREKCENLPFWSDFLEDYEGITVEDWVYFDALYRSRSLELPKSGESMVPVLDMINHSSHANAYFDENNEGEVRLLIRKGHTIQSGSHENAGIGSEITIDYGQGKSAAEMLFSYGFVEPGTPAGSLVIPLESMDDDPLAKPKLHVFGGAPTLKIKDAEDGVPTWTAPFVYLMCLNEDDGIDFRILQEVDGSRRLVLFWQDEDVTDKAREFEGLIAGHDLEPIYHLRAITVIHSQIAGQVESLETPLGRLDGEINPRFRFSIESVQQLRRAELDLMQRTLGALERQRDTLLENDRVKAYLGSMEEPQNEEIGEQAPNNEEDFS
ncbi:hypothetical protein TruAng_003004 [Truncatella angustata]|nr:hypothetical protein TruAng_003004 [Truncatella angustata]